MALIITIIVLLILAMVSIALVMNSGIITKSKTAVDKYSQEEIQEQIKLAYAEWQTAQWTSDAGDAATFMQTRLRTSLKDNGLTVTGSNGVFVAKLSNNKKYVYDSKTGGMLDEVPVSAYPAATAGTATTENSTYTSDGKTAVIPAGYTVDATQNSIDNGLVISKDGNEWVWIPVSSEDLALMYTEDSTGWTMSGTSGENAVVTKYRSTGTVSRGNPGTDSLREPDILTDLDEGDINDSESIKAAGLGNNAIEMAKKLKNEYENMIKSLIKNKGFYVGRYELSNSGVKKNQPSWFETNSDWYHLYKKCTELENDGAISRMMWGCQWDQICKFISTAKNANGETIDLNNSSSYGNYSTRINTGSNEQYKTNNIYDLAGNCCEYTQEAYGKNMRPSRGGFYNNYHHGYESLLNSASYGNPHILNDNNTTTRPVLILR